MAASRRFVVRQGDEATPVEVLADGRISVGEEGDVFTVTLIATGDYVVTNGAHAWRVTVAGPPEARRVSSRGTTVCLEARAEGESSAPFRRAAHGGLSAPMPGTVLDIAVAIGQQVRAGDVLLTLEAMKMELPIRAPRDGVVSVIRCGKPIFMHTRVAKTAAAMVYVGVILSTFVDTTVFVAVILAPRSFSRSQYPRSSIKFYQGEQTYSDLEPPFTPVVRQDWKSGRGSDNFDKSSTSYYDGTADATISNQVLLQGQVGVAKGIPESYTNWVNHYEFGNKIEYAWLQVIGLYKYIDYQFTPAATVETKSCYIVLRRVGNPRVLNLRWFNDNAGYPGTPLGNLEQIGVDSDLPKPEMLLSTEYWTSPNATLNTGAPRHLLIWSDTNSNADNYWEILTRQLLTGRDITEVERRATVPVIVAPRTLCTQSAAHNSIGSKSHAA